MRHLAEWDSTIFQTSTTGYHDIVIVFSAAGLLSFSVDGALLVSSYNAAAWLPQTVTLVMGGSTAITNVAMSVEGTVDKPLPPSPNPKPPRPSPPLPPIPGPLFVCSQSDSACAALGSLFYSTGGSSWNNQGGWSVAAAGVTTSYCTFYGVGCSEAGVVTYLCVCARHLFPRARASRRTCCRAARSSLSNNALRGTIPAALSSLTNLSELCGRVRGARLERAPHAAPLADTSPAAASAAPTQRG
jgi:hypothetical protein